MLPKTYDPKPVEEKRIALWESVEAPGAQTAKGSFVVVIPPPNVTGALHLGHALNLSIQDALVRWRRLQGARTVWVPGTDHGGIATQNVMEKSLKAAGETRMSLGRDEFVRRLRSWTEECRGTIRKQMKRLGAALDWERDAFTMDQDRARAVFAAFKALWEDGLVYRGERLVNWCVRCGTALSDIEVEREERKGRLWHIRYPEAGKGRDSGLVVATTRPETMLGDAAVAVHPDDARYRAIVGKRLTLPLVGREIPVVADAAVEAAFGTGAVKVTPAHDPDDFEIGGRHKLAAIKVIGPDGKMTAEAGAYAGLSREAARDKVVADLEAGGFLVKTEDHRHAVGVCYRCSTTIEPLLSEQWFVRMEELARPALAAIEKGDFRIFPANWEKPYIEWLRRLKDWCVSRQIWWGHRIPVWYCRTCYDERGAARRPDAKPQVGLEAPARCPVCGGRDFFQDPDVLDTWFSSALWPISVFGWPEETDDLKSFYPTDVLVTGYEILYLWVARMQMMGLRFRKSVPFRHALIHGIVRDKKGRKMSKSLGNVVDPLDMIPKYGADALRFSLLSQAHPGRDIPFAEDSLIGPRNFANKIWNATRFVLSNLPETPPAKPYAVSGGLELADRWIVGEFASMRRFLEEKIESYEIASAAGEIYGFLWDKFCDWHLELSKIRLQGEDPAAKETARGVLVCVLARTLRLLSPFMPFITEELLEALAPYVGRLSEEDLKEDSKSREEMSRVIEATSALRSLRAHLNVPPGRPIRVTAVGNGAAAESLKAQAPYLRFLAKIESLEFSVSGAKPAHSATAVACGLTFYVPLEGLIDLAKERARLEKELAKAESELQKIALKAENPEFLARAPEPEKALAHAARQSARDKKESLLRTLAELD